MGGMDWLQGLVDLVLAVGVYVLWVKLKQPPQDDPRLSRGLQLLQSKIAVLEDLSDRTEVQVGQLTALLEQKVRKVQAKIEESQKQIQMIDQSMQRSREVAEIFQDKIPHEEIIERQNTIKYIKAAQLAHEGKTVAEISQIVDLPIGEIEFIAKVNRDTLMFDSSALPEWARQLSATDETVGGQFAAADSRDSFVFKESAEDFEFREKDLGRAFDIPEGDYSSLKKLGDEFRQACRDYEEQQVAQSRTEPHRMVESARSLTEKIIGKATEMLHDRGIAFKESTVDHEQKLDPVFLPVADDFQDTKKSGAVDSPVIDSELEIIMPESAQGSPAGKKAIPFVLKKEEKLIRRVEFPRIDSNDPSR
jgi:hypothetical protein